MADRIGTEIAGYRIESLIARGGMGEVYLATQAFPERKVALKLLPHDLASDPAFRERFIRESNAAASLEHPNIVPVYGAGESDGELWIAMRFVDGEDLRHLLEREGPLSPERAASICAQVAEALEEAHEHGLVHRDVKPGNILIGKSDRAYLTDFGLIRPFELETSLTKTGQLMGTVDYVAPEQIRGQAVDGRADVYSLGCVLYECLTGEPPFRRETEVATLYAHLEDAPPSVQAAQPGAPIGADEIIATAMNKQPDLRNATAADMADDLRQLDRQESAEHGRRDGPAQPRHRFVPRLFVALIALVLGTVGVLLVIDDDESQPNAAGTSPISVLQIDPTTDHASGIVQGEPVGLDAVAAEGGLWVAGLAEGVIKRDEATGEVEKVLPVSGRVVHIERGFGAIWVSQSVGRLGSILRVNPATEEIAETVDVTPLGTRSGPLPLASGSGAVWTTDIDGSLTKIDPISNKKVWRRKVALIGRDVTTGSHAVWVADELSNEIVKVDPVTGDIIDTIELQFAPAAITFAFGRIWAVDTTAGTVTSIDPDTLEPSRSIGLAIDIAETPVSIQAGFGFLWVSGNGAVSKVNPTTLRVVDIPVDLDAFAVAPDSRSGVVWLVALAPGAFESFAHA